MRTLLLLFLVVSVSWSGGFDRVLRQTEVKYQKERCWEFSNLVTDMPWDTALGLGPETSYINVEGHGAIMAVVDKNDSDTTLAVGVSWGVCNSSVRSYRVHYYKKNSRGIWYETGRKRPN